MRTDSPRLIPGIIDTYIPAKHRWPRDPNQAIRIFGLHTPEGPETPTYAEALGAYFRDLPDGRVASTHFGTDNNSGVRYADDDQVCAAARGANHDGIHVEIAGRAGQTEAGWLDDYSIAAVRRAALMFAEIGHLTHGIPLRRLTKNEIADKRSRGYATHADIQDVFGGDERTDPGPHFPHPLFLRFATEHVKATTMTCPPMNEWHKVFNQAELGEHSGVIEWFQWALAVVGYWPRQESAIDGHMSKGLRRVWATWEQAQGYDTANDKAGPRSVSALLAAVSGNAGDPGGDCEARLELEKLARAKAEGKLSRIAGIAAS